MLDFKNSTGTELYQERMVEALVHHLKASLLVLDSCALAPHVSDGILYLVLLCNALDFFSQSIAIHYAFHLSFNAGNINAISAY